MWSSPIFIFLIFKDYERLLTVFKKNYKMVRIFQGWLESDIPPATSVRDSLYLFADWVKFGGPPVRQQMLEQGAYEAVTKAWSLICYSGIDGTVTLFS